jgi:hypothetical protein
MLRGTPTRRASEKVGSNKTKSIHILSSKKNAKILKSFYNSNGRSGCTQLGLLQIVQNGH